MQTMQAHGIELDLTDGSTSTRTTSSDGTVVDRYFSPPSIVVALSIESGEEESPAATAVFAAALLHTYDQREAYALRAYRSVDIDGAKDAIGMSFLWDDSKGVRMRSSAVVAQRPDGVCVVVHAAAPVLAGAEVDAEVDRIVLSLRIGEGTELRV
jgi:hypothetical protein